MKGSKFYLVLAVVGAVVPWIFFAEYFSRNGLGGFVPALFVNGAAGGFATDLLISSLTFWLFLFHEGGRRGMRRLWLYVLVNLSVGLSCALPLFLWARERTAAST